MDQLYLSRASIDFYPRRSRLKCHTSPLTRGGRPPLRVRGVETYDIPDWKTKGTIGLSKHSIYRDLLTIFVRWEFDNWPLNTVSGCSMEVRLYTVRKLATQLYEEVSFLKQKF